METRAVEEDVDKAAKEALANLRGSISVPGLDPSSVVDKYCEVEFKESLDNAATPEKREEMKKKFVDYYITGPGKSFIDECISQIQFYYKQAKEGVGISANKCSQSYGFQCYSVCTYYGFRYFYGQSRMDSYRELPEEELPCFNHKVGNGLSFGRSQVLHTSSF